jgi:hypothetical protein
MAVVNTIPVPSADGQLGELVAVRDRFGQRGQGPGVGDALVRAVLVVEGLTIAQGVQQMSLVPDPGAVQQLTAAGPDPPFHDRVHARHPYATTDDPDPCVREDLVEQRRVLGVPVPDQVLDAVPDRPGLIQVHHQVACPPG